MNQVLLVGLFLSLFPSQISGQEKQSLSESAYFNWNAIENPQISDDGTWVIYEINPNKGDGRLVVLNTITQMELEVNRGQDAYFDEPTSTLVCLIHPELVLTDSLKRKKVKEKDLPVDTLLIWNLETNQRQMIPDIKSLKRPDKWGGWIAYEPKCDTLNKLPRKLDKDETIFVIENLVKNVKDTFHYIKSIIFAEEAPIIYLNQNAPDSSGVTHVQYLNLINENRLTVFSGLGKVKNLGCFKDGQKLCFLQDADTSDHAIATYDQYIWNYPDTAATLVLMGDDHQLPEDWIISEHFQSYFSPEMGYLFLGATPTPLKKDTTLIPDEVVDLEIWHYQDQALYTQQEVQEKSEKTRSYLLGVDLKEGSVVGLGSKEIPTIKIHPELDLEWAIGIDDLSMRMALSWEGRVSKNVFMVSLIDGSKISIRENITGNPNWSPGGHYIYWYEEPDTTWYIYSIKDKKLINLTQNNTLFSDELNDQPDFPNTYGMAGWSSGDEKIYLYDRYDIWEANPVNQNDFRRLTCGREDQTQYRYIPLDRDEKHLPGNWMIHGIREGTKAELYARLDPKSGSLKILLEGEFRLDRTPIQAEKAEVVIFTMETFQDFPDFHLATNYEFNSSKKITIANPQQEEYYWGDIELVSWHSFDGQELKGLLVKPEHFDPTKKYPMIVNFYERSSDELHLYRAPAPGRSTINYSYYASNGYVIFNPDVVYKIGYPGESAYNAVVSGTKAIIGMGFIDTGKIALQGHSWGGYQIAHILTQTDMFACAESGAPVVNMISAYGGIRWGTGLSRMFQYEHTQSRLGANLWERPDLYIENSPIFKVDRIRTPVLILHNDEDSAVPWYQGIEFFVALRRLNKPAWLLNYNGEPHWPVKWQNKLDFNRRLFQFFEHYLKDAPMPVWMKEGIPAVEKGINSGLELTEKEGN